MQTGPQVAIPRTASEDLAMQVHYDDGYWHRRTRNIEMTACGMPLYRLGQTLRMESYEGPLCRICFTPFELALSAELAKER